VFYYLFHSEDWPATLTPVESGHLLAEETRPVYIQTTVYGDEEFTTADIMPRKVRKNMETRVFQLTNVHSGQKFTATAKGFHVYALGRKINHLELNFP